MPTMKRRQPTSGLRGPPSLMVFLINGWRREAGIQTPNAAGGSKCYCRERPLLSITVLSTRSLLAKREGVWWRHLLATHSLSAYYLLLLLVFIPRKSSAPELLEPVLWPRTACFSDELLIVNVRTTATKKTARQGFGQTGPRPRQRRHSSEEATSILASTMR